MDLRGKNNNNRPDLLKVKQKVFTSYPINSIARKQLVQEEKARDLRDFATHLVPQDIVKMAVTCGIASVTYFAKRAGLGFLGLLVIGGLGFFTQTIVETVLLIGIGLFLLRYTLHFSRLCLTQVLAVKVLKDEYQRAQDKLQKMKKDLFE